MQPLTRDRLSANAYRTLGLSASAGQPEIESAARRMRIWPDPARIPATPSDLPRLGPLSRSRIDVEHAVARLGEPASRLEDRLLWYHGERPPTAADDAALGLEPSVAERHDQAVRALHAASVVEGRGCDVEQWRQVITRFNTLSASPDYVAWLAPAEAEGNFEKQASVAEIWAAVKALPGAVAVALTSHAEVALARNDLRSCGAILALLREPASPPEASRALRRLLGALEDALDAHCRQMDKELRDTLRTIGSAPQPFYAANLKASKQAETFYDFTILADLEKIRTVAGDDRETAARAESRCADVLKLLALGWEWSGLLVRAEETLLKALGLADGPAAKAEVQKALDRVRPRAEEERRRVPPLRQPPNASTPARTLTPRWRRWGESTSLWQLAGVAAFLGIIAAFLLSSIRNIRNSSGPDYNTSSPTTGSETQQESDASPSQADLPPADGGRAAREADVGEVNREP